jgi:hypothetical protein
VKLAIKAVIEQALSDAQVSGFTGLRGDEGAYTAESEATRILELATNQNEY